MLELSSEVKQMKSDQEKLIETICHLNNKVDRMEQLIRTKKEKYENENENDHEEFSTIAADSISSINDFFTAIDDKSNH